MQLRGVSEVLLAAGMACLLFYGALDVFALGTAHARTLLLFVGLVGLIAGGVMYALSETPE
jgi:hypothetical protein